MISERLALWRGWGTPTRDMVRRMMARARWWHETGALLLCPTEAQLRAALTPWSPAALLRAGRRDALPWRGLTLPSATLVRALHDERLNDPGAGWLVQLLLPEPDIADGADPLGPLLGPPGGRGTLPAHVAELGQRARSPLAPPLAHGPDLRLFLHRCAQLPYADLAWARRHDITQPAPGRAWPPADDHFPVEVHGHRAARAARGLSLGVAPGPPRSTPHPSRTP